ncbi:MAG: 23S rRNA (adenine(2503)-C(2))-methyltransferase RlmN [Clostridia bacterium]|nr:23S rRNA (adenine(2503)-C(2))-methyltransferase RlmN [Clostridia bacterium]
MLIKDLKSLNEIEINELITGIGIPKFRAKQIFGWLCKGVDSFDEMSNVPKAVLEKIAEDYYISYVTVERKFVSQIDGTVKYLFRLCDDEFIESVVMKYKHGYSICVSTQVGCRMGCRFCASTIEGKKRDLTAGEILSQIFTAQKDLNIRISNIVLMGMGEPLDNYDNTLKFLELVSGESGLNIGMRHISLSTCGVVDKIKKLEQLKLQLTLSISLHAPNDEIRDMIMPINKKWRVNELIEACKSYINTTGRRISFEYAMIKDVNDSDDCAKQLIKLLSGMICHVNLIPANQVHKDKFERPDTKRVYEFEKILNSGGINATVRRTLGADINASCGQLKGKK